MGRIRLAAFVLLVAMLAIPIVALAQSAPAIEASRDQPLMSEKQKLIAVVVGAVISIIGTGLPLVIGQMKIWKAEQKLKAAQLDEAIAAAAKNRVAAQREEIALSKEVSLEAVAYAKEKGDSDTLRGKRTDGPARDAIATEYYKTKLPNATDDVAHKSVRAAVGLTPGVGASSKPKQVAIALGMTKPDKGGE